MYGECLVLIRERGKLNLEVCQGLCDLPQVEGMEGRSPYKVREREALLVKGSPPLCTKLSYPDMVGLK